MMRSVLRRPTQAVLSLTLAVTGTVVVVTPVSAAPLTKAPKVQVEPSVDGIEFVPTPRGTTDAAADSAEEYDVAAKLPGGTAAIPVTLPESKGALGKAEGAPISVGRPLRNGKPVDELDVATVRVLPRSAADKADVDGVLFEVAVTTASTVGAPATADQAQVPVTVDYSSFKDAYGGDWASRLQLVALPDCSLESGSDCPEPTPLETTNDPRTRTLSASAPMSASGGTMMLAAEATDGGDQGDFSASPLQASSDWSVGYQTGNFSWSYKIPSVPVPSGLAPEVSLGYSSQSVDGRTQASNNQTSWLGEGHSLETGFIERSYVACADSQTAGNKTGDQCWKNDNATISFKGQSGQLVRIPGTNEWRAKDDDGWRIRKLHDTTPGNGDNDGEFWELTDQGGTRYYFGKERRFPGDTASTRSAWTVPVFGDDAGEPCHDSTFGGSWCQQAWRWNLDYVVDVHNNTMTYFYNQETNHYGLNNNASQPAYVAGGHLARIEYGQVKGLENDVPATARTLFTTAERCIPDADFDCAPEKLTKENASRWPDVPFDRMCDDEASCQDTKSPAFFSRKRLVKVLSQVHTGTGYDNVDQVAFTHSFPQAGDGTGRSLWLEEITRTGLGGGGSQATPSVKFGGVQMPNRVLVDGAAPLLKWRVNTITTETGGTIVVTYSGEDCKPGDMPASPSTNTRRCFPAYWSQDDNAEPTRNWFHKYVVTAVTESDLNGTVTPKRSYFSYLGGAAWHYDDNELTKAKYRTWGEWRGYNTVEIRRGDPSEAGTVQSYEKHLYLRGMDGDRLPDGADAGDEPDVRNVTVTDAEGGTISDHDRYAGFLREKIVREREAGTIVQAEVKTPWLSGVTADDGDDRARILRTGTVKTRQQFVGTSSYRRTTVSTTYDQYGMPTLVHDAGDDAKSTDSVCTDTYYERNLDAWLISPVKRTRKFSGSCDGTPAAADVLSDVRYSFDGQAYDVMPTKGEVSREETLSGAVGAGSWQVTSLMSYDARGRVVSTTDANGNVTTNDYFPSGEGSANLGAVTRTMVTNAKGHQTETWLAPDRGVPTRIEDPNGRVTEASYDPLGRVSAVWRPGNVKGTDPANTRYTYNLNNTTYSFLKTETLRNDGTYGVTYDIYDALLRMVENQRESAVSATERVLTTTVYNSKGQTVQALGPYTVAGSAPSGVYYSPSVVQVMNNHKFVYDGAGRQTADVYQPKNDPSLGWSSTTSYDADRTKNDPPTGGTPTTEITDARGNVTARWEHLGTSPAVTATQVLNYGYDDAGRMVSMTDHKGNLWKWTFDLQGNLTKSVDPDKGTTTSTFDDNGNVLVETDNRGVSTRNEYDELGRRIATYDGTVIDPARVRATWEFDTLAAGQPTRSTKFQTAGDASTAFVTSVTGYDSRYHPLGTQVSVPSIAGLTDTLAGVYTTTMTYNDDGTLDSKRLPSAFGLPTETLNYSYDRLGNLKTLGGADSIVGASTYSPYNELLQITTGTTSGKLAFNTWYFDEGTRRLSREVVSNQGVTGAIVDTTYGYDQSGNVTRLADVAGTADDIQCFSYDFLGQLKEAWAMASGSCTTPSQTVMGGASQYWHSYTYDEMGNRKTRTIHPKTGTNNTVETYSYPTPGATAAPDGTTGVGGPHAVSSVSTKVGTATPTVKSFKYDAVGNMTTRGAQTYTWDADGRMQTSKDGAAATATNVYGADGARLLRKDDAGVATLYLDSTEIKLTGTTKTSQRWYGFNGKVVATRTSAGVQLLAADHHGTPTVQMPATTPTSYTKRRLDPFGAQRTGVNPGGWSGDHGFLDKSVDKTGLTMVGARFYDQGLGRFISVDPMMAMDDPQQVNAYAYAGNNPVTDSDPTGLMLPADGGGGGGGDNGFTAFISAIVSPVFSLVQSIASAIAQPMSYAAAVTGVVMNRVTKPLYSYRTWMDKVNVAEPSRATRRAIRAYESFNNGTHRGMGTRASGYKFAIERMSWVQNRDWNKYGKLLSSKWVRGAGVAGAVISLGSDILQGPDKGDSWTKHVLKVGVQGAFAAGFGALGASAGVVCGPAAAVCGTVFGAGMAGFGNWVGGKVVDIPMVDSGLTWTADRLEDAGGMIGDVVSSVDVPDIDLPDVDLPDVDLPDIDMPSCCSNPFND